MMALVKLSETVDLSIDIPDFEKKISGKIVLRLERLLKNLNAFNKHLNILYNPFKKNSIVSSESIIKYRGTLWDYSKKVKENFNNLKELAYLIIKDMNYFKSDTQISQLISVFSDDFKDVDESVRQLIIVISDWENFKYRDNVVKSMEVLKEEIAEFKKLLDGRIIEHFNTNVLKKTWIDNIKNKEDISKYEPTISRLYKDREKQLKNIF